MRKALRLHLQEPNPMEKDSFYSAKKNKSSNLNNSTSRFFGLITVTDRRSLLGWLEEWSKKEKQNY